LIKSDAALAVVAAALAAAAACVSLSVPAAADQAGAGQAGAAQVTIGAGIFSARCAVCHGPEAAGIPGSFPSLHEQVVKFAQMPEGRDYLVMVVTTGLMGELKVAGVTYRGVMPAQAGLTADDVAAVLSFLASDRGKNSAAPGLTVTDVKEARARHKDASSQTTRTLRPTLPDS
jgi:mono/diheme cytochrome c family protein